MSIISKGVSVRLVDSMGRENITKYGRMKVLKVTSRTAAWASSHAGGNMQTIVDVELSTGLRTWFPIEDLTTKGVKGIIKLNTRKLYV